MFGFKLNENRIAANPWLPPSELHQVPETLACSFRGDNPGEHDQKLALNRANKFYKAPAGRNFPVSRKRCGKMYTGRISVARRWRIISMRVIGSDRGRFCYANHNRIGYRNERRPKKTLLFSFWMDSGLIFFKLQLAVSIIATIPY